MQAYYNLLKSQINHLQQTQNSVARTVVIKLLNFLISHQSTDLCNGSRLYVNNETALNLSFSEVVVHGEVKPSKLDLVLGTIRVLNVFHVGFQFFQVRLNLPIAITSLQHYIHYTVLLHYTTSIFESTGVNRMRLTK